MNVTVDLDRQARAILRSNDRGGYTVPTAGLYPYQWNWDSAFAALGFAVFDIDRAWVELETLFSGQWANGMVPHILFHAVDEGYFPGPDVWGTHGHGPIASSGISQPPVAASFARRIYERDPVAGEARLRALFPMMKAWHGWFIKHRGESGAICVTHPWEAGRDNTPDWDQAMARIDASNVGEYQRRDTSHVDADMRPTKYDYDRYITLVNFGSSHDWNEDVILKDGPFRVADPTTTFILLRANRDLKALGDDLGLDTDEIAGWIERLEHGARSLWNPEINAFDSKDLRSNEFSNCVSNASFLNWYAGIDEPRLQPTLERVWQAAKYGIASYDPQGPHFEAFRYWRGPVWAIMNTMIGIGLAERGFSDMADKLRVQTAELIAEQGFAEYYHPQTGKPAGGGTFTWTAAVWLIWASPNAGKV